MKKLLLFATILFSIAAVAQKKSKVKIKKQVTTTVAPDSIPTPPKPTTKYTDNVDDRMKGPNGEKIYIGTGGGRYYLKNGKKIYVPYGNKNKKV